MARRPGPEHGVTGYRNGCTCDTCREANAKRQADYRSRRRTATEQGEERPARPASDIIEDFHDFPHTGPWAKRGACKLPENADINFFAGNQAAAKKVCDSCPVKTECLAFALPQASLYGTWGGTTMRERKRLRSLERKAAA